MEVLSIPARPIRRRLTSSKCALVRPGSATSARIDPRVRRRRCLPCSENRGCEAFEINAGRSTLSVRRVRRRAGAGKRVQVGAPDPSLTAMSGVAALAEFLDRFDVAGVFDRGIGSIKERARGVSAGELVVGLAQSQLLGGDALVALDRQRRDVAAVELSEVPVIASTTAG